MYKRFELRINYFTNYIFLITVLYFFYSYMCINVHAFCVTLYCFVCVWLFLYVLYCMGNVFCIFCWSSV